VANRGVTSYTFEDMFQCDPSAPNHGYTSWDNFFTRLFKDDIRPIASPNDDNVVLNACESKVYKTARDVKASEKFWIKGQPYSVNDMLAFDPLAETFIGGTIYQAFLSALSYHRWHSPVSGTIKKAYVIDGTYYSQPGFTDAMSNGDEIDENGETTGQEYISAMATRGVVLIQADNEKLGLVGFIGIGMIEVSTCDITVKEGQHVKKGDELG
jgi:phosphatidylserine decarboxylase